MLSISGSSFILHFFQIYRLIQFLVDVHYTVIVIPSRDNLNWGIKHWSSNSQVLTLVIEINKIPTRFDLICKFLLVSVVLCFTDFSEKISIYFLDHLVFRNWKQTLQYVYCMNLTSSWKSRFREMSWLNVCLCLWFLIRGFFLYTILYLTTGIPSIINHLLKQSYSRFIQALYFTLG